jgi:hypothetical protein
MTTDQSFYSEMALPIRVSRMPFFCRSRGIEGRKAPLQVGFEVVDMLKPDVKT